MVFHMLATRADRMEITVWRNQITEDEEDWLVLILTPLHVVNFL